MKKSTKVALTLLVPAMTAYGCSNQSKTVQAQANVPISQLQAGMTIPMTCSCGHSFTTSGDRAGKTSQCPKCEQTLTVLICQCGKKFAVKYEMASKKVHCTQCNRQLTVSADGTQAATFATYDRHFRSNYNSTYDRPYYSDSYYPRSTYRPWFGGWFGGYRSHTDSHVSSPPPASPLHPNVSPLHTNSTQSHTTTPQSHTTLASHAPSVSHSSSGGFGGTGAHFSGGS